MLIRPVRPRGPSQPGSGRRPARGADSPGHDQYAMTRDAQDSAIAAPGGSQAAVAAARAESAAAAGTAATASPIDPTQAANEPEGRDEEAATG